MAEERATSEYGILKRSVLKNMADTLRFRHDGDYNSTTKYSLSDMEDAMHKVPTSSNLNLTYNTDLKLHALNGTITVNVEYTEITPTGVMRRHKENITTDKNGTQLNCWLVQGTQIIITPITGKTFNTNYCLFSEGGYTDEAITSTKLLACCTGRGDLIKVQCAYN